MMKRNERARVGQRLRMSLRSGLLTVLLIPLAVVVVTPAPAGAAVDTFVVTSIGDQPDANPGDGTCLAVGGGCTLRAAIEEANEDNAHDTIEFALGGPATIVALSPLPFITESVTIDGSTNPGANCDYLGDPATPAIPTVAISGSGLETDSNAPNTTIRNLSIHSTSDAVRLRFESVVECSWIGLKLDGTPGTGQTGTGVYVFSGRVGGTVGEPGNVIGGFSDIGVSAFQSTVAKNRIGVRPDGSPAGNGVGIISGSSVRFNLVANSTADGVVLDGYGGDIVGNTIRDNGGAGILVSPVALPPPPGSNWPYLPSEFRTNSITNNGGLGIDRTDDSVDQGGDGPTDDMVTVTAVSGSALTVRLRATPDFVGEDHHIEVFFNSACDPSGFGEGASYIETLTVTPTAGDSFHNLTLSTPLPSGQSVSATVSPISLADGPADTSEFSNCLDDAPRFVVDTPLNNGDTAPGDGVCVTAFGGCSLRAAIEEVNGLGAGSTNEIVFDLPAGSSIAVSGSPLPAITAPIDIDATSTAGATCGSNGVAPFGLIKIQAGAGIPVGLELGAASDGSQIRGLQITGFTEDGVLALGDESVFECNIFGSATSGGNIGDGIDVRGNNNTVGGAQSYQGNLVAANQVAGVRIAGSAAFNQVRSNWIGTDGGAALSNTVGVEVGGSAANNSIGSFGDSVNGVIVPQGGNLIAGNSTHGINIVSTGTDNQVTGNRIGFAEDGSGLSNGRHGIRVDAPGVLIGRGSGAFTLLYDDPNIVGNNDESGMALFGDDVIVIGNFVGVDPNTSTNSGNSDFGIFLGGDDGLIRGNTIGHNTRDGISITGTSNHIESNLIGLEADGSSSASNQRSGVSVSNSTNSIGGDLLTEGNTIANNGISGVRLESGADLTTVKNNTIRDNTGDGIAVVGTATQNLFIQNAIFDNGGLGIDLEDDGSVKPNDVDDVDTGPNDLMNRIEILDVDVANTLIQFSFAGTPGLAHVVEFSASLQCDSGGSGEGLRPIPGTMSFTTDNNGDFDGVYDAQNGFSAGEILTALATSTSFGSVPTTTSEYSDCYSVPGVNQLDSDGDLLLDIYEINGDSDGDGLLNRLDDDDDGDGRPTAVENADPNLDGNPLDALNSDGAGPVDYLDPAQLFRLLDPACRVLDAGTVSGGDSIDFSVTGGLPMTFTSDPNACLIPATATAVMANVIIVDPVTEGNLRVTAAGTVPLGGIVNFSVNELDNSNAQSVPLSPNGELNVSVKLQGNSTAVAAGGIRVEILGFYEAAETPSLLLNTVVPCTVYDSRPSQGGSGPMTADVVIGADVVETFPANQGGGNTNCSVPAGSEGVLVNVVALNTSGIVDVSSFDTGATLVSNQTHTPTMNNSSAVALPLDNQGRIFLDVDVSGSSNIRLVVLGYYFPTMVGNQAAAGLEFRPVVPCTVFDTRASQGASGAFAGQRTNGQATDYDVVGVFSSAQGGGNSDCGIPASAEAVEINLVAVNASGEGNLRIAATGTTPTGGVLNFANLIPKMNNSNALVVRIDTSGSLTVTTNGGGAAPGLPIADVRGVVSGYYIFQFDES